MTKLLMIGNYNEPINAIPLYKLTIPQSILRAKTNLPLNTGITIPKRKILS